MFRYTDDRYTGDAAELWHQAGERLVEARGGGSYFLFEWVWDRQILRDMLVPDEHIDVFRDGAEVRLVCHEREGGPESSLTGDRANWLAFTVGAWQDKTPPTMFWIEGAGRRRPCPWVVTDQPQAEPQAEPQLGPPVTIGDLPYQFRFPIDVNMHDKAMRVIVDWPGACPAGRAEALWAIEQRRMDRGNRYEYTAIQYIHEMFPSRLEAWCRACGIAVEPRVMWFVRGCRVTHHGVVSEATVIYDPRNPSAVRPAWLAQPLTDNCVFVITDDSTGQWWSHHSVTEIV